MDSRIWTSAHVFHQGDHDALLCHLLRPFVDELCARQNVSAFFFVRHWEGGPHVRIRLLATNAKVVSHVRRQVEQRAREYLAAHPSRDVVDRESYARLSAHFGCREGTPDLQVRYPNDSVQFFPYVFEATRYGTDMADVLEQHFAESSQLALSLLRAGIRMQQRQMVALCAVILSEAAVGDRMSVAHNLTATWRYWSFDPSQAAQLEPEYARLYQRQRTNLVRLVAKLYLCTPESSVEDSGVAAVWKASIDRVSAALPENGRRRHVILDTCAHLLCNRLGLSPAHEGFVRYLAARAVSDQNGELNASC